MTERRQPRRSPRSAHGADHGAILPWARGTAAESHQVIALAATGQLGTAAALPSGSPQPQWARRWRRARTCPQSWDTTRLASRESRSRTRRISTGYSRLSGPMLTGACDLPPGRHRRSLGEILPGVTPGLKAATLGPTWRTEYGMGGRVKASRLRPGGSDRCDCAMLSSATWTLTSGCDATR